VTGPRCCSSRRMHFGTCEAHQAPRQRRWL
jgi:hypothetical protein